MLLNEAKKTAILQLLNCVSSNNVQGIPQLYDSKLFADMIRTVFPEIELDLIERVRQEILNSQGLSKDGRLLSDDDFQSDFMRVVEDSKTDSESASCAVQLSDTELNKSTASDREFVTEHANNTTSNVGDIIKPFSSASGVEFATKPVKLSDSVISQKYRLIQHFIDVRYNLKSDTLIKYSECWNKNEFELAIVSIFILSEVVRHYVHVNDPVIHTLSLLDVNVQQDLEELFNFFINERSNITREEVEKILSSQTLYKNSGSPNRSYFATPRRSCSSKYKRSHSSSTSPLQESVYTDSPLKTYFESPVFTRADIVSKEKEILKIRKILYEEESKCYSLQQKIEDLERKLIEKDKEMKRFKEENRMLVENEISKDCEECIKHEKVIEKKERYIEELEIDFRQKMAALKDSFQDEFLSYQVEVSEKFIQNVGLFKEAEREMRDTCNELEEVKVQKDKFEEANQELLRNLNEMADKLKLCEEKLFAANPSNDLDSSVPGECIDGYLKENKFQMDISQEKLGVDPDEITAEDEDQCLKRKICVEHTIKSDDLMMTELPLSDDVCDNEKFQSLKNYSENVSKEYSSVCDDSNKLYAAGNQFADTSNKEVPFSDNSYPVVTNDGIGSLWHLYNNSVLENDNAEGVSSGDNGLTKALYNLQKAELEINQMTKHLSAVSKPSSGPNGSNGLVGNSPVLKEFLEDLIKKVRICVSCLDQNRQAQAKFQNNNSISKNITTDEAACNSNSTVHPKRFECSKVGSDLSNNVSEVNQDNTALLEKTQELEKLKDKYKTVSKSWTMKEIELDNYKRKYLFLKREYQERLKNCKETELKSQKLEMEIKDAKKRENDFRRDSKREKCVLKMQIREMGEKCKKIQNCLLSYQIKAKDLSEENKKLRDEISVYKIQKEELFVQNKYLENQIENSSSNVRLAELSDTTNSNVENKVLPSIEDVKDEYVLSQNTSDDILKPEILSPSLNEVTSLDTGNESIKFGALCNLSLLSRSGFHLVTDDEESFVNHRSLREINKRFDSDVQSSVRLQELQRRNSMYPYHLQSCYPAEGVPMTPTEKVVTEHVNAKKKSIYIGKKRKVSEMEAQNQSSQSLATPTVKTKKRFLETPTSLKKWRLYRRNQRSGSIKPKP